MANNKSDSPIEEVRELRSRISARFGNDPDRLVAHYLELQEKYRDRLVDPSKPAKQNDQDAA